MNMVETRYGKFRIIDKDSVISRSLRLYGEWAQLEIELLEHFIRPGYTVVDAGAFIGTHARAFSHFVGPNGKVFAFEPRQITASILNENAKLAKVPNIHVRNCALGVTEQSRLVSDFSVDNNENFGALTLSPISGQDCIGDTVHISSLDAQMLDCLEFLKIDVEGMEIDVLNGAKETVARCWPVIFAECNSLEAGLPILKWCQDQGYQVYGVLISAYNQNNYKNSIENIFGQAQEAGLLMIPAQQCAQHAQFVAKHRLPKIDTADDLVLMLLHKPQYPYEVLAQTSSVKQLGINYSSPFAENALLERDRQIAALNNALVERDERLRALFKSRSWQLTRPLRFLGHIYRNNKIAWSKAGLGPSIKRVSKIDWRNVPILKHSGAFAETVSPVDIIVPVYRGFSETKACIESVLASPQRTPYELIIIDDCSPEPELSAWLEQMAASGRLTLHRNNENLGFVGTVNRGMQLHPDRDVLLLNSDAIVANDWLDRMLMCAYAQDDIATVTPFSNNATICSYPKFCEDNELPFGEDLQQLDEVFAKANRHRFIELPTGVGFCFYIRRTVLNKIGLFDTTHFGKGYGEENDFCQRAIKAGYKNVLAADVFVRHLGGVSFAASQNPAKRRGLEVLEQLHPNFLKDVHRFISADPIRPLRVSADLYRLAARTRPVILAISHQRGGGTQKHVDDLARLLSGSVYCLLLRPIAADKVELVWNQPGESLKFNFVLESEYDALVEMLRFLAIDRIHIHHLIGLPARIWELPRDLKVDYDFTVHDYYTFCPQISLTRSNNKYCGEYGIADCNNCLSQSPAPTGGNIETWRAKHNELLSKAARVIAPSADTATRLKRYFPLANIVTAWHPEAVNILRAPARKPAASSDILKIVVIGALSQIKGADLLEACSIDAARRGLPIKFELIGYAYRHLRTSPESSLTVHGQYRDEDLSSLLMSHAPDVVWFPAQWPETYSYTLSAALGAGLPVLVPNLGAFIERIAGRPMSWIYDWNLSPEAINDLLMEIKEGQISHMEYISPNTAVRIPTFQYPEDYLSVIPSRSDNGDAHTDVAPLVEKVMANIARPSNSNREIVVETLHRLRAHPFLSWLARTIPHATQRRVKNWLLNHEKSA